MELIPFPIAVAFLLWLGWPKIKGWFEDRAVLLQHRRLMCKHVPTPHRHAPIEEWEEYLSKATADSRFSLRTIVQLCCDFQPEHKPAPQYLRLVQLIAARLREFGYELVRDANSRFVLQEFKAK